MSIRRIDPKLVPPPENRPRSPRTARPARTDAFTPSASGPGTPGEPATYGRPAAASPARNAEAGMSTEARAQKLADIRRRIEEGVYNTRSTIEQVVDRLLDKWNLGAPAAKDESGSEA